VVARSQTLNFGVISLVVLTFILDIVLVGFLEISYHIPSMTYKVMEAYEGEHQSHMLVYEFEHITKKGRMCVIKVALSQGLGWFDESKV
jgi:hypothetical protein